MKLIARLIACKIAEQPAGGALPERMLILPWGEHEAVDGSKIKLNDQTIATFFATQKRKGWDRIALDFEHNTVKGTPEYERTKEPRSVAAFGEAEIEPGVGLFLRALSWTPDGQANFRNYCDLSPTPLMLKDGTIIGLHSVALCRHGAVADAGKPFSVEANTKEDGMDWKKWMCELLGKPEDTSDEDLKAAMGERLKALSTEAAQVAAAGAVAPIQATVATLQGAVSALPENLSATLTALSADVVALKQTVADQAAGMLKRDRDALLAQAAREGKVVALSADAIEALSVEQLREHVAALPVTVPLAARTPERLQPLSAEAQAAGEAVTRVALACGMDPAKVK